MRLSSCSLDSRSLTSYAYNADNQLAVVTGTQGVARYSYDAAGRLQQLTLPNALTTNYSYDGLNRLTNLHQDSPFGPLTAYSYTLDLNGNKTQAQEWVSGQAGYTRWQYNAGQRLALEAQLDGSAVTQTTTSYLYAPTGNRQSVTTNGSTTSYGYNRLDQLTVITNPNSTYVYQSYDGRGNLYQTVDGSNTTNYSYDYANRMVGASVPGHSVSYGYDAGGHRVQQTVDGNATNYLWDEQGYGEVGLEQSGGTTTNYLLAGGQRLAVTTSGLTNYYLPDGLGNIRSLAGSSGNLTSDRYQYDAYGSLLPGSVTATQNAYRYKGQQYDQATGLYNLRARYYNSTQGRFLSRDMAGYNFENPLELNRYGYAAENPVAGFDPSGYDTVEYGLQTSEDEQSEEALSREGQITRNLSAGATYAMAAFFLRLFTDLAYSNAPDWIKAMDERCVNRKTGRPSVTIAYSYVANPVLHPVVAAVGSFCPGYKVVLMGLVWAEGGWYHDEDSDPFSNNHAEQILYNIYQWWIPSKLFPEGTFYAIGVSQKLCGDGIIKKGGCRRFFDTKLNVGVKMRQIGKLPFVVAVPY